MNSAVLSSPSTAFDALGWSRGRLAEVERALATGIHAQAPAGLGEAMRYAVLDGGKRVRPLLVFAAAEAVAGHPLPAATQRAALAAACAVEAVHAYSLVHDDMPCMDNDVLRRGKPTVHVKFGEAQALLAGDALQAIAFEWLTPEDGSLQASLQAKLCALLARASGYEGMAGGQAIDLAHVGTAKGSVMTEAALADMHARKTGALLKASVLMGAACGGATPAQTAVLERYAVAVGLAFQVVDDVLDATADTATLGKTAGKDANANKPTYVSLLGLEGARRRAAELLDQAQRALQSLQTQGLEAHALHALAKMIVDRRN